MKETSENINWTTQLNKGDIAAFEQLFYLYHRPLFLYAISFFDYEEDAKDLVQDVFMKFWNDKSYKNILNDKALKTYLFRSVRNACLNKLGKKDIIVKKVDVIATDVLEEGFSLYNEDLLEEIKLEILNLPEKTREVITSVFFNKLKYKEAAEELGISVNTVKSYLRSGVQHLRNKFSDKMEMFLFYVFLHWDD